MAILWVTPGAITVNGAGPQTTVAATISPVVGNTVVVAVRLFGGVTGDTCTVADNASGGTNTYTAVDSIFDNLNGGFKIFTFYAQIARSGVTTITATTPSLGFQILTVDQFSGVTTASPLDGHAIQVNNGPGNGGDLVTSGTFSTVSDGDLVYGVTADETSISTLTHGTSFTQDQFNAGSAFMTEHRIQSAHGSTAATFNATAGSSEVFLTAGLALTAASTDTLMGAMVM